MFLSFGATSILLKDELLDHQFIRAPELLVEIDEKLRKVSPRFVSHGGHGVGRWIWKRSRSYSHICHGGYEEGLLLRQHLDPQHETC